MSFDALDEWDANFLEEACRFGDEVEARSSLNLDLSSRNQSQSHHQQSIVPQQSSGYSGFGPQSHYEPYHLQPSSYSPPRELSQRFADECEIMEVVAPPQPLPLQTRNGGYAGLLAAGRGGGGAGSARKDREVEKLKKELGIASKKLSQTEHECLALQKIRDNKEKDLQLALSQIEFRDAEIRKLRIANMSCTEAVSADEAGHSDIYKDKLTDGVPSVDENTKIFHSRLKRPIESTDTGAVALSELNRRIVTDNGITTSAGVSVQGNSFTQKKTTRTAGVQTDPQDGHASDSYKSCPETNVLSKLRSIWDPPSGKNAARHLVMKLLTTCSADFVELFRCMNIPRKLNRDSQPDESFYENSCHGMNSAQTTEATKITKLNGILMKCAVLRNILLDQSRDNNFPKERCHGDSNDIVEISKLEKAYVEKERDNFILEMQDPCRNEIGSASNSASPPAILLSCINTMKQIVINNKEEHIRLEAIFIMNLIMRGTPNSERDKYQLLPLLEMVSQLLQKEVGLHLQLQAVRLVFLLLNCQKNLVKFCSSWRQTSENAASSNGSEDATCFQGALSSILEGLADCLLRREKSAQDLKLKRHVIIVLAFIASVDKSGFNILVSPEIKQAGNFLELIIQVLASEMDAEIADVGSEELFEERTSLLREALILLNRLASSPIYSKTTLGVLTNPSGIASLTIDIANTLSCKSRRPLKPDGKRKSQMVAEIGDLARVFRTRVFAVLGEN